MVLGLGFKEFVSNGFGWGIFLVTNFCICVMFLCHLQVQGRVSTKETATRIFQQED